MSKDGEIMRATDYARIANDAHFKVEGAAREAVQWACVAGEALRKQKAALDVGESFIEWVQANCEFSRQTAHCYMTIADELPKLPNVKRAGHLAIWDVYKLASLKEPERSEVIELYEDTEDGVFKSIEDAIKERRRIARNNRSAPSVDGSSGKLRGLPSELADLAGSGMKFGTIYADPPWDYQNRATRSAAYYEYKAGESTTSIDWLCEPSNMPIADLAASQSHLHLWTTNAFIFEAKRVIEAWGFEYKSCFVWVKPKLGIGNYWRVSHEFLLLGVRGGLTFADRAQRSWAELPRGRHSAKPEAVRRIIEQTSPGPYLELFARRETENWTSWGNEVESDLLVSGRL